MEQRFSQRASQKGVLRSQCSDTCGWGLQLLTLRFSCLMLAQGSVLAYTSYVCIGQLQRVAACMAEVYKAAAAAAAA